MYCIKLGRKFTTFFGYDSLDIGDAAWARIKNSKTSHGAVASQPQQVGIDYYSGIENVAIFNAVIYLLVA